MPEDTVATTEPEATSTPEVESQIPANVDTGEVKPTFEQSADGTDYVPPTTEELAKDLDFDDPAREEGKETTDDAGAEEMPSADDVSAEEPEGKEPDAKEKPRAPEAQAEPDIFADDLLIRAKMAGISELEARSCGTPDNLRRTLGVLERQQAATERREPEKPPEVDPKDFEYSGKLDTESLDPAVVEYLQNMNAHHAANYAKLQTAQAEGSRQSQQAVVDMQEQQAAATEQSLKQQTVDWCKAHDSGDLFADPANVTRMHDATHMEAFAFRAMRRDLPPAEELRARAYRAEFGEREETRVRKSINDKIIQRSSQRMAKPTQRQTTTAVNGTPGESAGDFADRFYRERGIALDTREDL